MERQSPSIFNDIVGPVMVGPSSSHTCAPSRLGYLCRQLVGGKLTKVVIEFAREGAYTEMYQGQRSDMGFVNGLLGHRPEDVRLRDAFRLAEAAGLEVRFEISDFTPIKPNLSRMTLWDDAGEQVEAYTDSTGGGTVKILAVDGFETAITGDCYEMLIFAAVAGGAADTLFDTCKGIAGTLEGAHLSQKEGRSLVNLKTRKPVAETVITQIEALPGVEKVRVVTPILKVASNWGAQLPFRSAAELLCLAEKEDKPLWEMGVAYEMARGDLSRDDVLTYMGEVIDIMESGVKEALKGEIDMHGVLQPTAGKIDRFMQTDSRALDMGLLTTMVPWSMAAMEYSSAMGVVVCAPTGGSAGVFPGAVLGAAEALGLSREEKIKLMLTTAVIGIVMSKDCNYSAELYGCQVEPGAASAMAAGALVYLMDGTAAQSLAAASCATQNILGIICDPVAGLVQLPCISRNASAVANSLISANMVMGGYNPIIPLDEAAETMFRIGAQLPLELRCTCKGGLCTTPCGQKLAKEQAERDKHR